MRRLAVVTLAALAAAILAQAAQAADPRVTVSPQGTASGTVVGRDFNGATIVGCTYNGTNATGDCSATAAELPTGGLVTFTATAGAGATFGGWNGTCPTMPTGANGETCQFTVDPNAMDPVELEPVFSPDTDAHVAATGTGSGTGTIAIDLPGGGNPDRLCTYDGSATSPNCFLDIDESPPNPVTVTMTAAATGESAFGGFTGCPGQLSGTGNSVCTFTVDDASDDVTVTARFEGPDTVAALEVEPQGTGSGTITGGKQGAASAINCTWNGTAASGDCTEDVGAGQGGTFVLTAAAAQGSRFSTWTNCPGTVSADNLTCTFQISGPSDDVTIRPVFTLGGGGGNACTITGTEGDDTLAGTPGRDVICGLGGNDTIRGLGGNDELLGGAGNDRIVGGGGGDHLSGGAGNDRLEGGEGGDNLSGGAGNDRLYGGAGSDLLSGGAGADWLWGNGGSDNLSGGAGNDRLFGGGGVDALSGGPGSDRTNGGTGPDRCSGERKRSC